LLPSPLSTNFPPSLFPSDSLKKTAKALQSDPPPPFLKISFSLLFSLALFENRKARSIPPPFSLSLFFFFLELDNLPSLLSSPPPPFFPLRVFSPPFPPFPHEGHFVRSDVECSSPPFFFRTFLFFFLREIKSAAGKIVPFLP